MLAAVLSLSAAPAIGVADALAEDTTSVATTTSTSGFSTNLSIPTITLVDSSMDEAALRDTLSGGFMAHVDALAKLNATSITIPEITVTLTATESGGTPITTVTTISDLVLSGVKNGVADSISLGGTQTKSPTGTSTNGKIDIANADIGGVLALIGLVPGDATQPLKPLYTGYVGEGSSFDEAGVTCKFGKTTAGIVSARPVKVPFASVMDAFGKLEANKDAPPDEAIATVAHYIADILQAVGSTPSSSEGGNCSGTADGQAFSVSFGKVDVGAFEASVYPSITLNDIKVDAGTQGSFSLAQAAFKPTDLKQPIAAVEGAADALTAAWFETNYRKLIPSWGGFSLSGLSLDIPNPDKPAERIQAKIADFDLSLSDYLNGIPTKVSTKASGVEMPLPADSTDDSIMMLKAIGITNVNLNYEVSASWDQASQSITVDKVAVSGNDLGSFAVAAVIGNATDALFDVDPNAEQAAAMGLTVKSVKLDVADAGIADKMLPILAQQQGSADPVAFRKAMAAQAEGAAIALLGSTDSARALGAAVSDFVLGTKKALTINVAAKDPAGVSVPTFMQASNDPTILAGAVDITGSAQ